MASTDLTESYNFFGCVHNLHINKSPNLGVLSIIIQLVQRTNISRLEHFSITALMLSHKKLEKDAII